MALPAGLVLAATGVTLLEFPLGFAHVVASDAAGRALLAVRNGLLVAATLTACRRLWRQTVTEPRPLLPQSTGRRVRAGPPDPVRHRPADVSRSRSRRYSRQRAVKSCGVVPSTSCMRLLHRPVPVPARAPTAR